MFEGRTYQQQGGYKGWAIRFADQNKTPGVATTAYSFALSDEARFEMARRITAALNLTTHLTTEQMEGIAPLVLRSNTQDQPGCTG